MCLYCIFMERGYSMTDWKEQLRNCIIKMEDLYKYITLSQAEYQALQMKKIQIKENKKRRLTIRGVLSVSVAAIAVRSFFTGNYENLFTCILTLFLFGVPLFIDKRLRIDLPPTLEAIIYLFILHNDTDF